MKPSIPRVRELLEEIALILRNTKNNVSENNSDLVGVLESSIVLLEEARNELSEENFSAERLSSVVRIISDLIAIIIKIHSALFYKICRNNTAYHIRKEEQMTVGKNIRLFRTFAGLKQKELAQKVEIKESYLSSIENNKKEPSLTLLKKLSNVLNVPIAMFFWENIDSLNDETPEAKIKKLLIQLTSEINSFQAPPSSNHA